MHFEACMQEVPWGVQETLLLFELIRQLGTQWKVIGDALGRSGSSVRNKFNRMHQKACSRARVQKCRKCGQWRRGHLCASEEGGPAPKAVWSPAVEERLDLATLLDIYAECNAPCEEDQTD